MEMPHVEGVEHRYVEVNGFRMHVALAGPEDAPPLMLVHGWPQHWYEWRHLIPRFAGSARVICPDLRGLGWSDAPESGYEKEQLADDLIALLDSLGIERVKLVGHDWGGWVSFLLCLKAPERVERYLALNIPHPFQKTDLATLRYLPRTWYQWLIASPVLGRRALEGGRFVRSALKGELGGRGDVSDEEIEAFVERLRAPERARASQQYYRVFLLREMPRVMRKRPYDRQRLTVPTLLLFGTEDRAVTTGILRGYESNADDMQLELVPGVGHFIADERPDLVGDRIESFLGLDALVQSAGSGS